MQPPSAIQKKVVYIVNDFWLYQFMARCSLVTLRRHNPDIEVQVFHVMDGGANNRDVGGLQTRVSKIPRMSSEQFRDVCRSLNVKVVPVEGIDMGDEAGYTPAQRKCLAGVGGGRVLLLDADTFVFGSLDPLFQLLDEFDFVADKNMWGENRKVSYKGREFHPYNSGVVLWGEWLLPNYASRVYDYCMGLKDGSHPMSKWLYENTSQSAGHPNGREELACSLFVVDNDLRCSYTTKAQVQTEKYYGGCIVYHTLVQNWADAYSQFMGEVEHCKPRTRVAMRLLGAKPRFT